MDITLDLANKKMAIANPGREFTQNVGETEEGEELLKMKMI